MGGVEFMEGWGRLRVFTLEFYLSNMSVFLIDMEMGSFLNRQEKGQGTWVIIDMQHWGPNDPRT